MKPYNTMMLCTTLLYHGLERPAAVTADSLAAPPLLRVTVAHTLGSARHRVVQQRANLHTGHLSHTLAQIRLYLIHINS